MRKPKKRSGLNGGISGGCNNSKAAKLPAKQKVVVSGGRRGAVVDAFDCLPDDLVLAVLAGLAARAGCPADLVAAALPWSDAAHRFLRRCAAAGNLHACYFLGMVRFYCIGSRAMGAALLARAAAGGHAASLYALAVVHFNGSGGVKADKNPRAGVALCARAAWLGHVPALRELGHCLQDGYGARRDAATGRYFLLHAAARELVISSTSHRRRNNQEEDDAASRFMVEWWALLSAKTGQGEGDCSADGDVHLCSQLRCGRRETRRHEFRRCSACGSAIYCSRACQALDWKRVHRVQCAAAASRWLAAGNAQ